MHVVRYREENEQISKKEEARTRIVQYQNDLRENDSKVKVLQQEISRLEKTTVELQEMKKEKDRRIYGLTEEISKTRLNTEFLKISLQYLYRVVL